MTRACNWSTDAAITSFMLLNCIINRTAVLKLIEGTERRKLRDFSCLISQSFDRSDIGCAQPDSYVASPCNMMALCATSFENTTRISLVCVISSTVWTTRSCVGLAQRVRQVCLFNLALERTWVCHLLRRWGSSTCTFETRHLSVARTWRHQLH